MPGTALRTGSCRRGDNRSRSIFRFGQFRARRRRQDCRRLSSISHHVKSGTSPACRRRAAIFIEASSRIAVCGQRAGFDARRCDPPSTIPNAPGIRVPFGGGDIIDDRRDVLAFAHGLAQSTHQRVLTDPTGPPSRREADAWIMAQCQVSLLLNESCILVS